MGGISGCYSEEGFERLFMLANDIAQMTNPQLFVNLREERRHVPDAEWNAEIEKLKNEMKELIS